jgi:hypothetical protein
MFAAPIMGHGIGSDPGRLAVIAANAEIKVGFVVENPQFGPLRRLLVGPGLDHSEAGEGLGGFPDLIG